MGYSGKKGNHATKTLTAILCQCVSAGHNKIAVADELRPRLIDHGMSLCGHRGSMSSIAPTRYMRHHQLFHCLRSNKLSMYKVKLEVAPNDMSTPSLCCESIKFHFCQPVNEPSVLRVPTCFQRIYHRWNYCHLLLTSPVCVSNTRFQPLRVQLEHQRIKRFATCSNPR